MEIRGHRYESIHLSQPIALDLSSVYHVHLLHVDSVLTLVQYGWFQRVSTYSIYCLYNIKKNSHLVRLVFYFSPTNVDCQNFQTRRDKIFVTLWLEANKQKLVYKTKIHYGCYSAFVLASGYPHCLVRRNINVSETYCHTCSPGVGIIVVVVVIEVVRRQKL